MNLEQNPTQNQAELEAKRKKLQELENKQKALTKSLPITTQITILEREIKQLTNKPTRTQTEEALLTSKKQELEELLAKQNSSNTNRTGVYVGCGILVISLLVALCLFTRSCKKKNKHY